MQQPPNYRLFFRIPLLLLSLLWMLSAQTPKPMSLEQTLRASRWQHRVLLVVAPTAEHPDFKAQKALLAAKKTDLAERDFVVVEVLYNDLSTADLAFLKQRTNVQPPQFAAVLIGKDGGVKQRRTRPIPPAALFGTVDKMPMRQQEMRRQ